jgi:hypothetical protein
MFFNTPDFELETAVAGSFSVLPPADMQVLLERDYDAMTMTIMGQAPKFADVMAAIERLERQLHSGR